MNLLKGEHTTGHFGMCSNNKKLDSSEDTITHNTPTNILVKNQTSERMEITSPITR
jgi:hypothetical protein